MARGTNNEIRILLPLGQDQIRVSQQISKSLRAIIASQSSVEGELETEPCAKQTSRGPYYK